VSDDLRGTSRDSETLNGSASALPKWRYVVHVCYSQSAARHKTGGQQISFPPKLLAVTGLAL
jgi:hypothetical protein